MSEGRVEFEGFKLRIVLRFFSGGLEGFLGVRLRVRKLHVKFCNFSLVLFRTDLTMDLIIGGSGNHPVTASTLLF